MVVSAGNFGCLPQTTRCGYAGITSPGNAPSAITVGSLDTRNTTSRLDDEVPSYSSRGPSWYDGYAKPDVVAPGHRLVSTIGPDSTLGRDRTRQQLSAGPTLSYSRLSGTSMATAVASGAVALVLDANERGRDAGRARLTPNTVKALLEFTSFNVTGTDALTQGAGALDAAGAIELGRRIDPAAAPGTQWSSACRTRARRSAATGCRGRSASSGAIATPSATPSTPTGRPGPRPSSGATRSCRATPSSGAMRWSGVTRSSGATRWSGPSP